MARTLKHNNLFAHGDDRREVYKTLQENFNRDTWVQVIWLSIFAGAGLGAIHIAQRPEWFLALVAIFALERAIATFVDNSNRNWAMHVMDWIEESRQREKEQGRID